VTPKPVTPLPIQVVNDKGRYHSQTGIMELRREEGEWETMRTADFCPLAGGVPPNDHDYVANFEVIVRAVSSARPNSSGNHAVISVRSDLPAGALRE
jgi:hypothetical protein